MKQRRHPRIPLHPDLVRTLAIQTGSGPVAGEPVSDAQATDISLGGVGFCSRQVLQRGASVTLELPGAAVDETLSVTGTVTWVEPFTQAGAGQTETWYRYGVHFGGTTGAPVVLETERAETAVLTEIGRRSGASLELEAVFPAVEELVRQLLPGDHWRLDAVDSPRRWLTAVGVVGRVMPGWTVGQRRPLDNKLRAALRPGSPALAATADSAGTAPYASLQPAFAQGARSGLLAPLTAGGQVVGLLTVLTESLGGYGDHAVQLATRVAAQLAGPLAQAQLFATQRELAQEVQERRQAEDQLRRQAQLLASVRESVVATDLAGRVTYWGNGAVALYGHTADEAMGQPITFIVPAEEAATEEQRMKQVREQGSWQGQYRQQRKDGTTFWADTSISLVTDPSGAAVGLIGIDRDITAQREAEAQLVAARAATAAAKEADRLKDRFLSMVSHELRTPMTSLLGLAELLLREKVPAEQQRQSLLSSPELK
ncbi:MAG: hypothetical protein CL878_00330 [Dehalococcoidia bacterium]|nr:hypothetical protein [Dehalococcoidia bacterium]